MKELINEVLNQYKAKYFHVDNSSEILFRIGDAIKLINDFENSNVKVLALDFWKDTPNGVVPLVESFDVTGIVDEGDTGAKLGLEIIKKFLNKADLRHVSYVSFLLD